MLILLTLSFLPTSNRNSTMLGVLREAPKKQYSVPPYTRGPMERKGDITDSDSYETIQNFASDTPNAPYSLSNIQDAPDLSKKQIAPYDLFKTQSAPFDLFKKESALYDLFKKPKAVYHVAKKPGGNNEVRKTQSRAYPYVEASMLRGDNNTYLTDSDEININTHNVHVAIQPVQEKNAILNIIQNLTGIVISAAPANPLTDSEEVNTGTHHIYVAEKSPVVRKGFDTLLANAMQDHKLRNASALLSPSPDEIEKDADFKKSFGISLTKTGTMVVDGDYEEIPSSRPEINSAIKTMEAAKKLIPSSFSRTSSLAPGDILNGQVLNTPPDNRDPYIETFNKEMQLKDVGYLSVAFEELCEIVAFKRADNVLAVTRHTENVVDLLRYKHNRFHWLGEPMSMILARVAFVISISPVDELQTRAMIMKSLMKDRRKIVGADVNEALDDADSLVKKEDGERLFHVLKEFRHFPNGTKNEVEMCRAIIQAFENPFLRVRDTEELWSMVTKANQAFRDRFPEYSNTRTGHAKQSHNDATRTKENEHNKHRHPHDASSNSALSHPDKHRHKKDLPKSLTTKKRKHKRIIPNILV